MFRLRSFVGPRAVARARTMCNDAKEVVESIKKDGQRIANNAEAIAAAKKKALRQAAASKKKAQTMNQKATVSNQGNSKYIGLALTFTCIPAYIYYEIKTNREGWLGKMYTGSFLEQAINDANDMFYGIMDPSSDALLPDWPTAPQYKGVPLGTPAPPLLVLDLERTLIGSVHDPEYGWRHAKRPGLDKFLQQLNQYYEIVIFSENDKGMVQDIMEAIDPSNMCHKLGSADAEQKNNIALKRLDFMNREVGRIILIDDSEETSKLFPRNTILIKPYTNVNDKTDRALLNLLPLLHAMVHDDVQDFRDALDSLGTHEAEELVAEYEMRVSKKKMAEQARRDRGLGGIVRQGMRSTSMPKDVDSDEPRSTIKSSKDLVEEDALELQAKPKPPPANKKKGKLWQWLEEQEKAKEETDRLKMQMMNEQAQELYNKKMEDKRKKEQDAEGY